MKDIIDWDTNKMKGNIQVIAFFKEIKDLVESRVIRGDPYYDEKLAEITSLEDPYSNNALEIYQDICEHYAINFEEIIDQTKEKLGIVEEQESKSSKTKIRKKKRNDVDEEEKSFTSFLYDEENITEQIYDYKKNISNYLTYNIKTKQIKSIKTITVNNEVYYPNQGEELAKKAILLPTGATEFGTDEKLDSEILEFISQWLDVPDEIRLFALWNIKRSWVYERFHTLNYLRAQGDTGMGKTRFLDTLGGLHYKPIATSGATTAAPVFRVIDKWKGTLIMDEADFSKSDESQDIIKIINLGYERGKHVMRCDQNDANKINFFDPFCPKILATRRSFEDKATESRCITHVMTSKVSKKIPVNLNDQFFKKTSELRNKLLMWRFKNYHKIDPTINIDLEKYDLESRVQQIVTSFISLFAHDEEQLNKFMTFIKSHQETIIDERKNSFDGSIVGALHSLIEKKWTDITTQDLIDEGQLTGFKNLPLKPRALVGRLKSLGFGKTVSKRSSEKVKRCINLDPDHMQNLFKRYGYDVTIVTVYVESIKNEKKWEKPIQDYELVENVTVGHAPPYNRYNRNNVTGTSEKTTKKINQNFQKIDPTFLPCSCCGSTNKSGWTLENSVNGKIFCDICAGVPIQETKLGIDDEK